MSEVVIGGGDEGASGQSPLFSARAVLALVLVGIVAFAGLAVLSAYAPELRSGNDGRAHALSRSAIGYAGAPILMKGLGETVLVSRTRPRDITHAVVVLTPDPGQQPMVFKPFETAARILIVLPKWQVTADPKRKGFVQKVGTGFAGDAYGKLLGAYSKDTKVKVRSGAGRPALHGAGGMFAPSDAFTLGPIDRLQTVSGQGWAPALVDETGAVVLAYSKAKPDVWLLADPDLLNNQGIANLNTARAGAAILQAASQGERSILFDVTLNGFARGRGLGRLVLEPPWLAATLCAVGAAVLMGFHALARFGQPRRRERPFALGAAALVDNSADLVRMARKEPAMATPYAALIRALVLKAGGGHMQEHWLEDLAARRGATAPSALAAEAEAVKTRDDMLVVARKLYEWRGEMTRERR